LGNRKTLDRRPRSPATASSSAMSTTMRSTTLRVVIAALLASAAQGFLIAPAAITSPRALQQRTTALPSLRMGAGEMDRRKMVVTAAGGLAAALLGSRPAVADNLVNGRAACTVLDCPAPKTEQFELVDNIVKSNEYTGKGASFKRPSDDAFKRVSSPSSAWRTVPSSQLFRSKTDPNTAIFFDVEQIVNKEGGWTPGLKAQYTNTFKDKFKLVSEGAPTKDGGMDRFIFEYTVSTELEGKNQVMHYITTFVAAQDQVYIMNAQSKDDKWATVGAALRTCAESLKPNI